MNKSRMRLVFSILLVVIYNGLCVKVEEHYIRAIEIYELSLGPGDTNVAKTKNNLVRFSCRPNVVLTIGGGTGGRGAGTAPQLSAYRGLLI